MRPVVRLIALEYSAFALDGRPDLGMAIYNPATPKDQALVQSPMAGFSKTSRPLEVGKQAGS
jgi:hypothetical protein